MSSLIKKIDDYWLTKASAQTPQQTNKRSTHGYLASATLLAAHAISYSNPLTGAVSALLGGLSFKQHLAPDLEEALNVTYKPRRTSDRLLDFAITSFGVAGSVGGLASAIAMYDNPEIFSISLSIAQQGAALNAFSVGMYAKAAREQHLYKQQTSSESIK